MTETNGQKKVYGSKQYDLEDRTFEFAMKVREFIKRLPRTPGNLEDEKQLVKASGSVGANYIEANESLGKKDFLLRIRICRKEAKESRYWLRLLDLGEKAELGQERNELSKKLRNLRTSSDRSFGKANRLSIFGFWVS